MRRRRQCGSRAIGLVMAPALLAGCASPPVQKALEPQPVPAKVVVLGRSDSVVVVRAQPGDTAASLAERYLGDSSRTWRVRPLAPGGAIAPGFPVAIALKPLPAGGPAAEAMRVPILCYHRFTTGKPSRMDVNASRFEEQIRYLKDNGYTIISLKALLDFMDGRSDLPSKPVVITIDDGYRSAYTTAFPILRRHGAPATLFVYSDFIGSGSALDWKAAKEMQASGLVDIQSHSKSHADLRLRRAGESAAAYQKRLAQEMAAPREEIMAGTSSAPWAIAYPYGAANAAVLDQAAEAGYRLGLTVQRGLNPEWAEPLLLRRDMVYGTDTLEVFASRVSARTAGGARSR